MKKKDKHEHYAKAYTFLSGCKGRQHIMHVGQVPHIFS